MIYYLYGGGPEMLISSALVKMSKIGSVYYYSHDTPYYGYRQFITPPPPICKITNF